MEKQNEIRICKDCKINNNIDHKFRGKCCIKCCSKKINSKLNENNYYKKYYMDHRPEESIFKIKSGRPRQSNLLV